MKKKTVIIALTLAAAVTACCVIGGCSDGEQEGTPTTPSEPAHTHTFNKQVVAQKFLKSEADCTQKAVYYLSCECGERGDETFESGELGEHKYNNGVCGVCGENDPDAIRKTATEEEWNNAFDFSKLDDCEVLETAFGIPDTSESYGSVLTKFDGNKAYVAYTEVEISTTAPYEILSQPPYIIDEKSEKYFSDRTSKEAQNEIGSITTRLVGFYDKFTYDEETKCYNCICDKEIEQQNNVFSEGDAVTVEFENGKPEKVECIIGSNFKQGVLVYFKFGGIEITLP